MTRQETIQDFLALPINAVVIGIRRDGRPHATPNWFHWDGTKFYISTTRRRAKYRIFKNDPRIEIVVDDSFGQRYVCVTGTVAIREDLGSVLQTFRTMREKYGIDVPGDDEFLDALAAEERVLLVVTPDSPQRAWLVNGLLRDDSE
jgi:PPOX class probable F420-dependent enzyme